MENCLCQYFVYYSYLNDSGDYCYSEHDTKFFDSLDAMVDFVVYGESNITDFKIVESGKLVLLSDSEQNVFDLSYNTKRQTLNEHKNLIKDININIFNSKELEIEINALNFEITTYGQDFTPISIKKRQQRIKELVTQLDVLKKQINEDCNKIPEHMKNLIIKNPSIPVHYGISHMSLSKPNVKGI